MERAVILVALDTSPAAEAVLPYVVTLARALGAAVSLLSVLEPRARALDALSEALRQEFDDERIRGRTAYLEQTAGRLRARGLQVETTVGEGEPADEIIIAADDADASLVAMTGHGHGKAPGLGATADRVLRQGHRPVLIVAGDDSGGQTAVRIRHIMVPLDGSAGAESAYCPATELARALRARLALVRAQPWLSPIATPYSHLPGITRQDEHAGLIAEHYLEQVQQRDPGGIRQETFVLRGTPREELLRFAREDGVDLTVMATHGRGGLARRLLGSTAERMVRAGLPVLLIPPRPATPTEQAAEQAAVPRCAGCGRAITFMVNDEAVCPRCRTHLHRCANCALWDGAACLVQRPEAHDRRYAGHGCPRFTLRHG